MNIKTTSYKLNFDGGVMTIGLAYHNGQLHKHTWDTRLHCNADYELHLITKGTCVLDVENAQYNLSAGQAVLVAPGKYHKSHVQTGDFERFTLGFILSDGPLQSALQRAVPQSMSFLPSEDLYRYCSKFIEEGNCNRPLHESAQHALLTLLAISLFRNLQLVQYVKSTIENEDDEDRIQLIDAYFERHFATKGGCQALADKLHLSTRQLGRILKEHYGMTFQEKLIHTRMEHAALLLRTTDKHMPDIIDAIGYNSATAFYKAFSAHFGLTPQQYRRTYK